MVSESQAQYFCVKITPDKKNEIFEEYIALPRKEQWHYCSAKAAELGVAACTIRDIVHDEDRLRAYLAKRDRIRDMEMARAYANLGKALDVQIGILNQADTLPDNMKGLAQNAATDLMNRLNFKEKVAEEDRTMHFIFGSDIALGMPPAANADAPQPPDGESEAT